jgi:hypothetical protein
MHVTVDWQGTEATQREHRPVDLQLLSENEFPQGLSYFGIEQVGGMQVPSGAAKAAANLHSVGPRPEQQVDGSGGVDDDHAPWRISRMRAAESLES